MGRPWKIAPGSYLQCMEKLFPMWLRERGGIVVYENHTMDSSHFGDRSFMPAKFYTKDDELHDAPQRIGDVPSRMQERVDHITLKEFGGELNRVLACFVEESVDDQLPVWKEACGHCGTKARPKDRRPFYHYTCPMCARPGCARCMPEGNGNICSKCAGRDG